MVTESTLNPPLVRAADTVFFPRIVFEKKLMKWWKTSQRSEFGAFFFDIFGAPHFTGESSFVSKLGGCRGNQTIQIIHMYGNLEG